MRIAAVALVLGGSAFTDEAGCHREAPEPQETTITWTIPNGPGTRGVELVGCHDWDATLDLEQATVVHGWSRCAIRAWRRDGLLTVTSPAVPLEGRGDAIHVVFDLPEGRIAGMGATVRATMRGVRIDHIFPGSPAERAGLAVGDHIVAVAGKPTQPMNTHQFVRAATGAPGTAVRLTVSTDRGWSGSRRDVALIRVPLDARGVPDRTWFLHREQPVGEALVGLSVMTTNLVGAEWTADLGVTVATSDKGAVARALPSLRQAIRDVALDYSATDLHATDGRMRFRADLQNQLNHVLDMPAIRRVYFTHFAIE